MVKMIWFPQLCIQRGRVGISINVTASIFSAEGLRTALSREMGSGHLNDHTLLKSMLTSSRVATFPVSESVCIH